MTATTDALDQTTSYHYDNRNNLVGLTDANDNTHVFTFDRADRMTSEARPMGETIVYTYDAADQLTSLTDPVGNRAEYEYDGAGRRTQVRHFAADQLDTPERTVTFTYDARGRMTGYDDGMLSGSYTYDNLGRKTEETVNYPGFSKTYQQSWHANSRQASLTAPDGTEYGFSWDEANRMQSVTIPGEGVIAYSEYGWQQPATVQYPGGTTRESTHDGLQRHKTIQVTDEAGQVLMDYQYTWDETGNITEKATEHGDYSYGYDEVDRLTQAEYPTFSAEEWTYDPLGNRITDTGTGEAEWQYNDNNELLDSVEHTHEYDDNGRLVAEYHPDGTLYRTFEYNAENRMSAVKDATGEIIAEYLYDPFGRRVSKTVYDPFGENPETTWFVYSEQGLMAELDDAGQENNFYLFPPDGLWSTDPVMRKSGSSYFYYQTDHLGTPQQLVDGAGSVVHAREMRAFGEVQQVGIEDGLRFPGQSSDAELGLNYNNQRYYSPRQGRYVRRDPLGIRAGVNSFQYVDADPLYGIDPYGLCEITGRWEVRPHGGITDVRPCTASDPLRFTWRCIDVDNPFPWQKIRYKVGLTGEVSGAIRCVEKCDCPQNTRNWRISGSLSKDFVVPVPIPGTNWCKRLPGWAKAACYALKYRKAADGVGGMVDHAKKIGRREIEILVMAVEAANNPDMWCNAMRAGGHVRFQL